MRSNMFLRHCGKNSGYMLLCLFVLWGSVSFAQTTKPVWQQTDPEGGNYLKGRRALAGKGCEVNMLVNTVTVASWANGLDNLVDDDLTNFASFPTGVSIDAGVAPIVSIRDMENHYAGGTVAGFVVASAEGSLLSLDVVKAYAIQFYCDGKEVGTAVPVTEGQSAGALNLSLIKIPGSDDVTSTLSAVAPGEFDEVCLMPAGGVNLELIKNTRVKYAFAGNARQYNLVNAGRGGCSDGSDGIYAFNEDFQTSLKLEVGSSDVANTANFIDADLENNGVTFLKLVAGGGYVEIKAMPEDYVIGSDNNKAPFKAGTVFGFHFAAATDVLNIGGKDIKLCLGKKNGLLNQPEDIWGDGITVSGDILKLSLSGGNSGNIEIRTNQDCYGAKLEEGGVGLGGMNIRYAYIRTPDEVNHRCDMRLSADAHICDSETSYKITGVDVSYEITSQPEGANAQIDAEGNVTGMTVNGSYEVTATSTKDCGCKETVTIHRGMDDISLMPGEDNPLYNVDNEVYELSTETHITDGGLISLDRLSDKENVLNAQTGDYAQYVGGLGLAENVGIVGVKTKDGSAIKEHLPGKTLKRVGFMVETLSDGLGLDALKFFCIRGFKGGKEAFNKPVEETNAVSLDLIGSSKVQKMRYSVAVPDDAGDIDEFQLWKEGVLNLKISKLNIYYAFADDTDNPVSTLGSVTVVSDKTGASLNADRMAEVAVADVACVKRDLTNLIDDDPEFETAFMLAKTVAAGGSIYAVNLGRTYRAKTQVGFVLDNKTYMASIGVGKWIKMVTYLNGQEQESQQDWKVLGVSVIGAGDKRFVTMQPETDFDEVSIEFSGVADALDYVKIYGVFVRDDTDGDGIPDVYDESSCSEDIVLNEEVAEVLNKGRDYDNARLLLHRTFNRGNNIGDNLWSSIVLPVSLTGLQVRNAFGNDTRLAEVKGMEGDLLVFRKIDVPTNDDVAVIKPGVFYIIETVRTPEHEKTEDDGWDTFSDGTQYTSGDVYVINGVDYSAADEVEPTKTYSNTSDTHSVTFAGTYNYKQALPEGIYAFSRGLLWRITNSAKMKGFRFWINETLGSPGAKQMIFRVDGDSGGTTGLTGLTNGDRLLLGPVYDAGGRCVGTAGNLFDLPRGVYVVNGRKILIK